jgi:hypothetical protein
MMTLTFGNGEAFAPGEASYDYRPATSGETTPRVVIEVTINGITTEAMVDTGGVYFLCNPRIARRLQLEGAEATSVPQSIEIRGFSVQGRLYRLLLTIPAESGETLDLQVTAFVPEEDEENWGDFPCILGFFGGLERARFAIDPVTETFYFGPTS